MEHRSQSFFFSSIASWRPCLFARLASLAAFFWALRFARASASSLDDEAIVAEICKLWDANGQAAAAEGTKMHEDLEKFIQGLLPPWTSGLLR